MFLDLKINFSIPACKNTELQLFWAIICSNQYINKKITDFRIYFRIWTSQNSCELTIFSINLFSTSKVQFYLQENRINTIIWYLWKNIILTQYLKGVYIRKIIIVDVAPDSHACHNHTLIQIHKAICLTWQCMGRL